MAHGTRMRNTKYVSQASDIQDKIHDTHKRHKTQDVKHETQKNTKVKTRNTFSKRETQNLKTHTNNTHEAYKDN